MEHKTSWNTCGCIIVLAMFLGVELALWSPVYLAPPLVKYTPVIYAILAQVWLPLFFMCRSRHQQSRIPLILAELMALIGVPVALCSIALVALYSSMPVIDCQQDTNISGLIRYTCELPDIIQDRVNTVTFEGVQNLPFMRFLEKESLDY
jgi:hypothetical protein